MLTTTDYSNLVSIINNTTFKGIEAETVSELKKKLVALAQASEVKPD